VARAGAARRFLGGAPATTLRLPPCVARFVMPLPFGVLGAADAGLALESRSLGHQQRGVGQMDQCILQFRLQAGGGIRGRDRFAVAVQYQLSF
jgi:hypothetical protein